MSSASHKPELRGRLRATSERSKKLGETSQVVDSMEYTCAACQRNFTNLSVRMQFATCAINRNKKNVSTFIEPQARDGWVMFLLDDDDDAVLCSRICVSFALPLLL